MLRNITFLLLVATYPLLALSATESAAAATVFLNALGMGVTSRAASSTFYSKVFGIKKGMTMPVANMGQGGWTEDIDTFPSTAHSSALVLMEWQDKRSVKNLPIKLTFVVDNPQQKQALVASSGGKVSDLKTEMNPDAIYATDPDGYLLELIKGEGIPRLRSVGIGVTNLNESATWWAGATGLAKGQLQQSKEWDIIGFKPEKATELLFIDWHETPKRPTKNMPIKLVFAATSTSDLTKNIQKQSPKGKQAGGMAMFQFEPLE